MKTLGWTLAFLVSITFCVYVFLEFQEFYRARRTGKIIFWNTEMGGIKDDVMEELIPFEANELLYETENPYGDHVTFSLSFNEAGEVIAINIRKIKPKQ